MRRGKKRETNFGMLTINTEHIVNLRDTRSEKTEKNDDPPVEKYFPARKRLTNIRSHNNPQAAQIC